MAVVRLPTITCTRCGQQRPYKSYTFIAQTKMLRFHAKPCACGNKEETEIDPTTLHLKDEDDD